MKAKAYFEAIGRSDQSRGLTMLATRDGRKLWPIWARHAYVQGWMMQAPFNGEMRKQHRELARLASSTSSEQK